MSNPVRVAALQFASGTDVDANLATCLRMIDEAAKQLPELMVLPEFCNHISWYDDDAHAWEVAVAIDGGFLAQVAALAARHSCYIDINVSLRREYPAITVTSLLYGPDGSLISWADKQTLMGHENDFFVRADTCSPVVDTPLGKLGIFPCRDGVTFETPRGLALHGAQLFCDSLNSFAIDEASLHVPARAPENKVFLVSANKVGPLIPEQQLEAVSAATLIPVEFLMGAGESQIVHPDGTVLAMAPAQGEAVIVADIDLDEANDKRRPDGTDLFAIRRPELYGLITQPPAGPYCEGGAESVEVAIAAPVDLAQLEDFMAELADSVQLLVLPELVTISEDPNSDSAGLIASSQAVLAAIQAACQGRSLHVCTSLAERIDEALQHNVVLIDAAGIVARQPQLHHSERHRWASLGDAVSVFDLPWAKVAMLSSDDAAIPESAKLAALQGAHVLLVPGNYQEDWESRYGLLSRAAENRMCLVTANRSDVGEGMVASLERDFTIMTPWQSRIFDGKINHPLVSTQKERATTVAEIHPIAASNKLMSANTDLLQQRPWRLSEDITDPTLGR
ncbi:MAG: carbon-nitrogen hydrolase family protein [Pseudomonadales bacterium]